MVSMRSYTRVKAWVARIETRIRRVEMISSVIELLVHVHVVLGRLCELLIRAIPFVGLLFSGCGHLVGLLRPEALSPAKRISAGVKWVCGVGMISVGVLGLCVPALGMGLLAIGLGFGVGRSAYKAWRTACKWGNANQAKQAAAQLSASQDGAAKRAVIAAELAKHAGKWPQRVLDLAVSTLSCAAVAVAAWVPPLAMAGLCFFAALNVGYTVYRLKACWQKQWQAVSRRVTVLRTPVRDPIQATLLTSASAPVMTAANEANIIESAHPRCDDGDDDGGEGEPEGEGGAVAEFLQEEATMLTRLTYAQQASTRPHPAAHPATTARDEVSDFLQHEQAALTEAQLDSQLKKKQGSPEVKADSQNDGAMPIPETESESEHESVT